MYTERLPAVVVPPTVFMPTSQTSLISTGLQPTSPYASAEWQQHPHHERSLQEFYNAHGIMVRSRETIGTQLDRLV